MLLALTRNGISASEAEAMDPYTVAAVLDLIDAENRATAQKIAEAEANRG